MLAHTRLPPEAGGPLGARTRRERTLSEGEAEVEVFDPGDMRNMGGLRKTMPITFWVYLIGALALAGIVPLSGFFSKDEILWQAWSSHDGGFRWLWWVGFIAALCTAFYMFRLYFSIFWGKEPHYHHTPHEAGITMKIPLILLAVGALFAGQLPCVCNCDRSSEFFISFQLRLA